MRSATPNPLAFRDSSPTRVAAPAAPVTPLTRAVSIPRARGRSATPQRAACQNSASELLRKMEHDVSFYNKVMRALAQKQEEENLNELDELEDTINESPLFNSQSPAAPVAKMLFTGTLDRGGSVVGDASEAVKQEKSEEDSSNDEEIFSLKNRRLPRL